MTRPSANPIGSRGSASDPSYPSSLSSLEIGKLWIGNIPRGPDRADDSQILTFLDKKPAGDKWLTLGVNDTQDVGPQLPVVMNDSTTFLARLGGGCSQQYPEVLLGCQLERQLGRHIKVFGGVEYAGDPADVGYHRVRAKAAWEVLLDAASTLTLRTSVVEASNYTPNGEPAKNLNYALDLVWTF